jgi:Arc/MetJ family transcription regulator
MRQTITLDVHLLDEAMRLTGMADPTALVHAGLRMLIERGSARRLAKLGGSEPDLKHVQRRRSEST